MYYLKRAGICDALESERQTRKQRIEICNYDDTKLMEDFKSLNRSRRSIIVFILLSLVLGTDGGASKQNDSDISWKLMHPPVRFGETAELECSIQSDTTPTVMAWIRIPHGETLALNMIPSDVKKYEVNLKYNASVMEYILKIKYLNYTDLNVVYKCDSDFKSVAKNLTLNSRHFIALPSHGEIQKTTSVKDGVLAMEILAYPVYPMPSCNASYQGQSVDDYMKVTNTENLQLYRMKIEISNYKITTCEGTITLTCLVGVETFNFTHTMNECEGMKEGRFHYGWIIAGMVLPVLMLLFFLLYVKSMRAKKEKKCAQGTEMETKKLNNQKNLEEMEFAANTNNSEERSEFISKALNKNQTGADMHMIPKL